MTEFVPRFAPVVVLLFVGTAFLIGVSFLVLLYGAMRRSTFFAKLGAGAVFAVVMGYLLLLGSVSAASNEKILPAGGWKVFCEIDCHIWYSVADTQVAAVLGPEMQQTAAKGKFVIVRLKTWFNENTVSPRRGNGPLLPAPRNVALVDDSGKSYSLSSAGAAALATTVGSSTPLDHAVHPGESFTTDLIFDVPQAARGLRLLITDGDPVTDLLIGHENSLLHKKIYLGLPSTASANRLLR